MKSVREVIEGAIEAGVASSRCCVLAGELEPAGRGSRALMRLLRRYVQQERDELKRQGVEVHIHGDRDRLAGAPRRAVDEIERHTRGGRNGSTSI
jgi:undecaprenyl pyrophosphate synthase